MVRATCEIDLKLPSLNDYTLVCRGNRYEASRMKKHVEMEISMFIQRLPQFTKPVRISFRWIEKDSRRDLDNIAFAKKFILDALVRRGKLIDDSQRYVKETHDYLEHGKENKVILTIEEI